MSTIKQEYQKERHRVLSLIRQAAKRGYMIPDDIIPRIPKRPTRASIRHLKNITPSAIYKKAMWVDPLTGDYLSGVEGRQIERQRAAQKSADTRKRKAGERRVSLHHETEEPREATQSVQYVPDIVTLSYDNLMGVIESCMPHVNAAIMKHYIEEYVMRYGKRRLIEVFGTERGMAAIARATEIAEDSDGERAVAWATALEQLLVTEGIITFETYKEAQDMRAHERWEKETAQEVHEEGEETRKREARERRILEQYKKREEAYRKGQETQTKKREK